MIEFYKTYWERLARRNKHIAHTDEEKAFFYVKDKYNPKAFDDAIKSAAKTTVFLLERYTSGLTDNLNKNYFRQVNGRFTIVLLTETGDQESIELAENKAEAIALSFIKKMNKDFGSSGGKIILDSGEQQPVFFKFEELPVDPVGPLLQKYYGVTVGFPWRCPFPGIEDPGDWLDND